MNLPRSHSQVLPFSRFFIFTITLKHPLYHHHHIETSSLLSPSPWNILFIVTITLKHPLYCHRHSETSSLLSPSLWNILFIVTVTLKHPLLSSQSFWNILFTITVILKHPIYCHRHSETSSSLSPSLWNTLSIVTINFTPPPPPKQTLHQRWCWHPLLTLSSF